VGALLGVLDALGVGLVGVSGSAVTVGMGSVEPASTVGPASPGAVAAMGDSTAEVVRGAVPLHAESVSPRTTAIAAEANPALRLPPLRTPVLTCICLP